MDLSQVDNLSTTTDVQNYPGYSDVIQGPWLMDQMKEQSKAVGTEMIRRSY